MSGPKPDDAVRGDSLQQALQPSRYPDVRRRWRNVPMVRRTLALLAGLALVAIAATPAVARKPNAVNAFHVQVLQSPATDPRLVNGWGIVAGPAPPWWVSDNGTDTSTLYTASGAQVPLNVVLGALIPRRIVFNASTAFPVAAG